MDNIKEFSYYEDKSGDMHKLDSVVTSIIEQFTQRSIAGKAKYGTDLDRTDLTLLEWIEHAKQEHMDAILYLEKIKQIVQRGEKKIY
jgi:hypothetical protein